MVAKLNTDMVEPSLAKDRREQLEDKWTKLSTEMALPIRAKPKTEKELPSLWWVRRDSEEEKDVNENTDIVRPSLV